MRWDDEDEETPTRPDRPDHPEPGQQGWKTKSGDPVEIVAYNEESDAVWVRFPKSNTLRNNMKMYTYDRRRWETYWTFDPETPEQKALRELKKIVEDIQADLRPTFSDKQPKMELKQQPTYVVPATSDRMEIFMRMTLNALDLICMHLTATTPIRMTAFDPPLHNIPGGPRFIPPDALPGGYYSRQETLEDDED